LLLPVSLSLALGVWGLRRGDAVWHDEAVTLGLAKRSLPELWQTLGNIDAVHGLYYLAMHWLFEIFGSNVVVLRLPAVIATVAATAGVAMLGLRLAGWRAGQFAGITFAALVDVQQYAQEGRSYALVTALVTWSTYLLILAVDASRSAGRAERKTTARLWVAYAAMMLLACLVHEFAVLALAAHAIAVPRVVRRPWTWAAIGVISGLTPLAVLSLRQSEQVAWIDEADWGDYRRLLIRVAIGGVCAALIRPARTTSLRAGSPSLRSLSLPLLIAPTTLLLLLSLFRQLYVERYVLYSFVGLALLLGAALDQLLSRTALVRTAVVLLAITACVPLIPASLELRTSQSRHDDVTALAAALRTMGEPGDGVIYLSIKRRVWELNNSSSTTDLVDIAQKKSPKASHDLYGTEVSATEIRERMRAKRRILAVQEPLDAPVERTSPDILRATAVKERVLASDFDACRSVDVNGARITLYARPGYC
jgi:mannosyltransferase